MKKVTEMTRESANETPASPDVTITWQIRRRRGVHFFLTQNSHCKRL